MQDEGMLGVVEDIRNSCKEDIETDRKYFFGKNYG